MVFAYYVEGLKRKIHCVTSADMHNRCDFRQNTMYRGSLQLVKLMFLTLSAQLVYSNTNTVRIGERLQGKISQIALIFAEKNSESLLCSKDPHH